MLFCSSALPNGKSKQGHMTFARATNIADDHTPSYRSGEEVWKSNFC